MDYKDYLNWAKEYREQANILNEMLEKKKKSKKHMTPEQQQAYEREVRILYSMKLDCAKTMAILEAKAKQIKESEAFEENIIA